MLNKKKRFELVLHICHLQPVEILEESIKYTVHYLSLILYRENIPKIQMGDGI